MTGNVLLTVGNALMGDDAAGALLARRLRQAPLVGWEALEGGSAPENCLHRVRELEPERVLVVDAADMDLEPGAIRLIGMEQIADPFLITTHTLPLSYLLQSLREFVPQVELLGIQPRVVAFGYPVSSAVQDAVACVYESLRRGEVPWERLAPAAPLTGWDEHP